MYEEEEDKIDSDLDADEKKQKIFYAERTKKLVLIKSEGLRAKKKNNAIPWTKLHQVESLLSQRFQQILWSMFQQQQLQNREKTLKINSSITLLPRMVEVQSVNPRGGKQFTHRNLNPFRAHPNDNRSSRQYFLSEDSEDISISGEELCCVCKMSTPDAARNSTSLIFVKWLQCYKCRHWVQINYYICTQSGPDW